MADVIDKITIKNPNDGSSKDYPIGADSSNVKYKSTSVYSELNDLNANKVDKHQTGGIDDRLMTKDEADKLAGIEAGAEVNIQSDWTQSDNTQADYIKNKPTNLVTYNSEGKIDASYLPSYVDDVLEYASTAAFPAIGEDGKIYVAKDTNKTYRWSGTIYVEISESLALGYTHSTAFYGDEGKAIADCIPSTASSSNKLATQADIPSISYPVTSVNGQTGDIILKASDVSAISSSVAGVPNGVATLDGEGKVLSTQLPEGITIKKAVFNIDGKGGSEYDTKELIRELGDFMGELLYNYDPSTHKYSTRKAELMYITLSDEMDNFKNHNNSNELWYEPYDYNRYSTRVPSVENMLKNIKYTTVDSNRYGLSSRPTEVGYMYQSPLEKYDNSDFVRYLQVKITLPDIGIRYFNGEISDNTISSIYSGTNFISLSQLCYDTTTEKYVELNVGNYISYKDIGNTTLYDQNITVYYHDL